MKKDLAIWGWWQGQNLGDQWIKNTMHAIFPEAEFVDTNFKKLYKYKFVICGGGGLFISSVPKIWKIASKMTHYGMLGLGAEFEHIDNCAKIVADRSDFFYIRDKYSLNCMHVNNMPQSYDITFYNPLPIKKNINKDGKCFFIWRKPDKNMFENENFFAYQKAEYDYYDWENTIKKGFSEVMFNDFITYDINSFKEIQECDFVISGRYHGIISAIQMGIPCIAIDVCPKIRSLMKELGLESLCLKYNQVDELEEKISYIKTHYDEIRSIELEYRAKAIEVLEIQIENAKLQIKKVTNPIKIAHYGYYFFGSNDVVSVMASSLKNKNKNVRTVEIKPRILLNDKVKTLLPTPNGIISIIRPLRVVYEAVIKRSNVLILNSGGLTLDKIGFFIAKKFNMKIVGLELSDPDVFQYNGNVFSNKFDLYYTNAKYSVDNQYRNIGVNAGLLGFAADSEHHFPMKDIEKKYDVVIVGGARPDRIPIVNELRKYFNVGVYGKGWEDGLGFVSGMEQVRAINSGKIYLSFSMTMAGYNNVKVGLFEAIACQSFVITEYMDELNEYFKIGEEIVCYSSVDDLIEKINYYLKNNDERELIAEKAYQRFLNQHTYDKRWNIVFSDLYKIEG